MVLVKVCHAVVQINWGSQVLSEGKGGWASSRAEGACGYVVVTEVYLLGVYCGDDEGNA